MKTHIPDHATGRTYCGRKVLQLQPGITIAWIPACIDLAHDCIESATCLACQRADDRRQVDEYRRERAAALFKAACLWAEYFAHERLEYRPRACVAIGWNWADERWWPNERSLRDLEDDAFAAGAL